MNFNLFEVCGRSISIILLIMSSVVLGKIYERCELARELKYRYSISDQHVATWVCIANHESHLDTSIVNRGSGDHGLFQISELYWCSPGGKNVCKHSCKDFEDDDIEDDVECIKVIFEEHDRLFGNGFQAWVVYPLFCTGDVNHYVEDCFDEDNVISGKFKSKSKPNITRKFLKDLPEKYTSNAFLSKFRPEKPLPTKKTILTSGNTTVKPQERKTAKSHLDLKDVATRKPYQGVTKKESYENKIGSAKTGKLFRKTNVTTTPATYLRRNENVRKSFYNKGTALERPTSKSQKLEDFKLGSKVTTTRSVPSKASNYKSFALPSSVLSSTAKLSIPSRIPIKFSTSTTANPKYKSGIFYTPRPIDSAKYQVPRKLAVLTTPKSIFPVIRSKLKELLNIPIAITTTSKIPFLTTVTPKYSAVLLPKRLSLLDAFKSNEKFATTSLKPHLQLPKTTSKLKFAQHTTPLTSHLQKNSITTTTTEPFRKVSSLAGKQRFNVNNFHSKFDAFASGTPFHYYDGEDRTTRRIFRSSTTSDPIDYKKPLSSHFPLNTGEQFFFGNNNKREYKFQRKPTGFVFRRIDSNAL